MLKSGGVLLISVPNAESAIRRAQVGFHRLGRKAGRPWLDFVQYSRNQYSKDEFEALLRTYGFETEKAITFGSPIPRWMQRWRRGGSLLMFLAVRP